MTATGNNDEVKGDPSRFLSHSNLPANGAEGTTSGTSYSFDYGSVHFTFLNSEAGVNKQTEWMKRDLAGTDRPWKIVALHRGPYGGNQLAKALEQWTPLFDEFGVRLVLQGHNHEYSRSYPLKGDEIAADDEGTVYVAVNSSGPKFNEKKEDLFYHRVHVQNGKQTFAGITADGDKLAYEAYDVDGKKLDSFELNLR